MKIFMLALTTILLFSCASSEYASSSLNKRGDDDRTEASSTIIDLTEMIRGETGAYVRGTGVRANISVRNQCPLFILNGSRVADYRMLYNLVAAAKLESVKVLLPQEAFMYGYGASFHGLGVIVVTTKETDFSQGIEASLN